MPKVCFEESSSWFVFTVSMSKSSFTNWGWGSTDGVIIGASMSKLNAIEFNCRFFIGAHCACPTLVVKTENGTCVFCIYILSYICAQYNISTLHIGS